MPKNVVWVLFDLTMQVQSQPLTQDQMQLTIFKIKHTEFSKFYIWSTNWQNWQPLNIFLDCDQIDFFKDAEAAKKIAEEKTTTRSVTKSATLIKLTDEFTQTKSFENGFDAENLTWSGAAPPKDLNFTKTKINGYSNRSARHELKIEILLISAKGKTFRSYSKNISLSGTLLEDRVPFDYYGHTFDVIIVSRYANNPMNSRVQLKSKTVGDGLTSRLQFESVSSDQKKRLTLMLNEYVEKQKKYLKKSA